MSNLRTTPSAEELTPELKQALVEIGAIIPTTAAEVALVENKFNSALPKAEVSAAFDAVLRMMDGDRSSKGFIKPIALPAAGDYELAMAARNGHALDAETLAKIEADVAKATRKHDKP